jgi:hypothetical protein
MRPDPNYLETRRKLTEHLGDGAAVACYTAFVLLSPDYGDPGEIRHPSRNSV